MADISQICTSVVECCLYTVVVMSWSLVVGIMPFVATIAVHLLSLRRKPRQRVPPHELLASEAVEELMDVLLVDVEESPRGALLHLRGLLGDSLSDCVDLTPTAIEHCADFLVSWRDSWDLTQIPLLLVSRFQPWVHRVHYGMVLQVSQLMQNLSDATDDNCIYESYRLFLDESLQACEKVSMHVGGLQFEVDWAISTLDGIRRSQGLRIELKQLGFKFETAVRGLGLRSKAVLEKKRGIQRLVESGRWKAGLGGKMDGLPESYFESICRRKRMLGFANVER